MSNLNKNILKVYVFFLVLMAIIYFLLPKWRFLNLVILLVLALWIAIIGRQLPQEVYLKEVMSKHHDKLTEVNNADYHKRLTLFQRLMVRRTSQVFEFDSQTYVKKSLVRLKPRSLKRYHLVDLKHPIIRQEVRKRLSSPKIKR